MIRKEHVKRLNELFEEIHSLKKEYYEHERKLGKIGRRLRELEQEQAKFSLESLKTG